MNWGIRGQHLFLMLISFVRASEVKPNKPRQEIDFHISSARYCPPQATFPKVYNFRKGGYGGQNLALEIQNLGKRNTQYFTNFKLLENRSFPTTKTHSPACNPPTISS